MSDRLVRRDPFRDLVSIQDDLSRLFGRTFGGTEALRPSVGTLTISGRRIQVKAA